MYRSACFYRTVSCWEATDVISAKIKWYKIAFYFSALGTIGAIFICAVTATKYFEGTYKPEIVE